MSNITTRQERPLGLLEKYQTSKQLTRAYGNISLTALLQHDTIPDGETPESFYICHLQPALTRLIETHPALSVVVRNKSESTAHFEQLSSIDLAKVIDITSEATPLQELIREQTSVEFDLDALLPLWRLKVVAETSTFCTVVLAMHHVIGDGMSLTIFYQDFVQALNSSSSSKSEEKSTIIQVKEDSKLPLPYELSNAPNVSLMMDVFPVLIKGLVPKVLPTSIARLIDPISVDGWKGDHPAVEGEPHQTEARLIHVPMDIWKPISAECKSRGISAHAIVFAAMLLAWQRMYPGKTTEVGTPINCRGLCNPPVPKHQIGNFVGSYTSYWTGKQLEKANIWKMAKKYHQDLQKNKVEAAKQSLFLKYLPEFPASYCDYWYDKRKNSELGRAGGIELSDLGKFTVNEEKSWKINQLYFCQSAQTFTVAFGMNSISYNDNLYCTLNWQKGALDDNKTNIYHDAFIGILKDCIPI